MQTVSYNDLTKRAQGLALAAAKRGDEVYAEPARRGWTMFFEPVEGAYLVVDIPATNSFTQQAVVLSQDAQNWIRAMKEIMPVLTESEIVCAALQHYALYVKGFIAVNPEVLEEIPSPYAPEVVEQWQNETEAAIE